MNDDIGHDPTERSGWIIIALAVAIWIGVVVMAFCELGGVR